MAQELSRKNGMGVTWGVSGDEEEAVEEEAETLHSPASNQPGPGGAKSKKGKQDGAAGAKGTRSRPQSGASYRPPREVAAALKLAQGGLSGGQKKREKRVAQPSRHAVKELMEAARAMSEWHEMAGYHLPNHVLLVRVGDA